MPDLGDNFILDNLKREERTDGGPGVMFVFPGGLLPNNGPDFKVAMENPSGNAVITFCQYVRKEADNRRKAHKVKEPEHRGAWAEISKKELEMLRPMDFNELAAKTMRLEERIRELSDKLSKLEKQNYLLREQLNDNSYRQP